MYRYLMLWDETLDHDSCDSCVGCLTLSDVVLTRILSRTVGCGFEVSTGCGGSLFSIIAPCFLLRNVRVDQSDHD